METEHFNHSSIHDIFHGTNVEQTMLSNHLPRLEKLDFIFPFYGFIWQTPHNIKDRSYKLQYIVISSYLIASGQYLYFQHSCILVTKFMNAWVIEMLGFHFLATQDWYVISLFWYNRVRFVQCSYNAVTWHQLQILVTEHLAAFILDFQLERIENSFVIIILYQREDTVAQSGVEGILC